MAPPIKYPKGKPCPCGCGRRCVKYLLNGVHKGWSKIAPDCLNKHKTKAKAPNYRTGPDNHKWKPVGSTRIHNSNPRLRYRLIKVAEPDVWRFEHRHVMEQHLGQKLPSDWIVHHRNGDTLDNRLDNLELMTPGDHNRRHGRLKTWSRHHDACTACGQTDSKHWGNGRCNRCHHRNRRLHS